MSLNDRPYIVPPPFAWINNSVEDKMTDALQEESEGNLGYLVENSHWGTLSFR